MGVGWTAPLPSFSAAYLFWPGRRESFAGISDNRLRDRRKDGLAGRANSGQPGGVLLRRRDREDHAVSGTGIGVEPAASSATHVRRVRAGGNTTRRRAFSHDVA